MDCDQSPATSTPADSVLGHEVKEKATISDSPSSSASLSNIDNLASKQNFHEATTNVPNAVDQSSGATATNSQGQRTVETPVFFESMRRVQNNLASVVNNAEDLNKMNANNLRISVVEDEAYLPMDLLTKSRVIINALTSSLSQHEPRYEDVAEALTRSLKLAQEMKVILEEMAAEPASLNNPLLVGVINDFMAAEQDIEALRRQSLRLTAELYAARVTAHQQRERVYKLTKTNADLQREVEYYRMREAGLDRSAAPLDQLLLHERNVNMGQGHGQGRAHTHGDLNAEGFKNLKGDKSAMSGADRLTLSLAKKCRSMFSKSKKGGASASPDDVEPAVHQRGGGRRPAPGFCNVM